MKIKYVITGMLLLLSVTVALTWPSGIRGDKKKEFDRYTASTLIGQQVEVGTDENTVWASHDLFVFGYGNWATDVNDTIAQCREIKRKTSDVSTTKR